MREVRTANFLFQFPEKLHIERHAVLHRKTRRQQGGEGWPLIVGGATPKIALTVAMEHKGGLLPLRLIGWLHVEVIVDRDGGIGRVDEQLAKEHGISRRLHDLDRSPTGLQDGGCCLRAPLDVCGVCRVHADGRNFDEIMQ